MSKRIPYNDKYASKTVTRPPTVEDLFRAIGTDDERIAIALLRYDSRLEYHKKKFENPESDKDYIIKRINYYQKKIQILQAKLKYIMENDN